MKTSKLIILLLTLLTIYPASVSALEYIDFDDSVDGGTGTSTGNWRIDRVLGNSYAGSTLTQGESVEVGGSMVIKAVETPEGIYVVGSQERKENPRLSIIQDGVVRFLMDTEGDMEGPIGMCQGGYPAWSEFDKTLYLTGPRCLRKIVNTDGVRTVEVVAGTCVKGSPETRTIAVTDGDGTDPTDVTFEKNYGIAATTDGIVYWLGMTQLRAFNVTTKAVTTVSLTWTGRDTQLGPTYWGPTTSDQFYDNLSLGEDNNTLYINDYADHTYGYGVLKTSLSTPIAGTISKYIGIENTQALASWADIDGGVYAAGTVQDGTPDSVEGEGTVTFRGGGAGRYHKKYNALLLSANDNPRYRWYELGANNAETLFGWRVDLSGGNMGYDQKDAWNVDGELFYYGGATVGFTGDGSGDGIYIAHAKSMGLHRAYDSSDTSVLYGRDFLDSFPDTSMPSSRDARVKAAIVKADGTFLNTSFEIASISAGVQTQPKVAYLNDTYLVVWAELSDSNGFNVKGVRLDGDGVIIDTAPLVFATGPRTQTMPDVAADGTGFMVVWGGFDSATTYDNDPQSQIYGRRVPLTGPIGSLVEIAPGASPEIAWNEFSDTFLIAYTGVYFYNQIDIAEKWIQIDSAGNTIVDSESHPFWWKTIEEDHISIASRPGNGDGWVMVRDRDHPNRSGKWAVGAIVATPVKLDGSGFGIYDPAFISAGAIPPQNLTMVPGNGCFDWQMDCMDVHTNRWPYGQPAVATDSAYVIAVWGRYDEIDSSIYDSDLYMGRLDGHDLVEAVGGVELSATTGISERNPSISGDKAGNLIAVYEKVMDGERQIASRKVTVTTSVVPGVENVLVQASDGAVSRGYPDITYNSTDDNYLLVWQEGFEGLNAYSYPEVESFTESTVLTQDGYPTPEQLAIFLPGTYADTVTATMRYKKASAFNWTTGHDLFQITDYDGRLSPDLGFAWTITGLAQGTDYVVEVTTHDGSTDVVETKTMSTSNLPAAAGTVTTTIPAGSTEAYIEGVFAAASAGDVIQFENGTYNVTGLQMQNDSGTEENPIYISGESRDGVILSDTVGAVFTFNMAQNVVLENLTIHGSMVNNGQAVESFGIDYYNNSDPLEGNITVRYVTVTGVDIGLYLSSDAKQFVIYENIFEGHHTWDQDIYSNAGYCDNGCSTYLSGPPGEGDGVPDLDESVMWNDVGIEWGGSSNVAFNNTFTGFGDTFKFKQAGDRSSLHVYRNNIKMAGDDGVETDVGKRNLTVYDNRITNAMSCVSADGVNGGPLIVYRNICINVGRQMWKLNSAGRGYFFYNNTVMHTVPLSYSGYDYSPFIWTQPNVGWQEALGFQNNISIYQNKPAGGYSFYLSQPDLDPIDWTNNSYYPDDAINWSNTSGGFSDLADAQATMLVTAPVFSDSTHKHDNDLISELQPFDTAVVLGANYHTDVTTMYTPTLTAGGNNVDAGVEIVGITPAGDSTPNIGAIMDGFSSFTYGATVGEAPDDDCSTAEGLCTNAADCSTYWGKEYYYNGACQSEPETTPTGRKYPFGAGGKMWHFTVE